MESGINPSLGIFNLGSRIIIRSVAPRADKECVGRIRAVSESCTREHQVLSPSSRELCYWYLVAPQLRTLSRTESALPDALGRV